MLLPRQRLTPPYRPSCQQRLLQQWIASPRQPSRQQMSLLRQHLTPPYQPGCQQRLMPAGRTSHPALPPSPPKRVCPPRTKLPRHLPSPNDAPPSGLGSFVELVPPSAWWGRCWWLAPSTCPPLTLAITKPLPSTLFH